MIKIGYGYDSHRFAPGNHVMIGGIKIPHTHGIQAHSDGDVLLHALTDALLGALALGDIGQHFPDTDPAFANVDSAGFVTHTLDLIVHRGYRVGNVDATVIAETPKLKPHATPMRENIAQLLGVDMTVVSIKASTNEKMGWIGRGEGLAAQVVLLLVPHD